MHTSVADFSNCSVANGAWAASVGDGAVRLAGNVSDPFDGPALDAARWTWGTWNGGAYTPAPNGTLTVDAPGGAFVRSQASYAAGAVEGAVAFSAAPWQHFGFAGDGFAGNYAIFSTYNTSDHLFVRVGDGGGEQRMDFGAIPPGIHRYRVAWSAPGGVTQIQFYIDGVIRAQFGFTPVQPMYAYLSNNTPGAAMIADMAEITPPFVTSGTFVGCAFDAGASAAWGTLNWTADLPAGTSLSVETRTSNDAATWSAWSAVATSGAAISSPAGRFLQYRLTLGTTDTQQSPAVLDIGALLAQNATPTSTTAPATATPTSTAVPATATPSNTPIPASQTPTDTPAGTFPANGLLDTFNRADGAIGSGWSGQAAGYAIASNQLDVGNGGDLYWAATRFGATQEVYVTLSTIDASASEIDLLLKAQDSSGYGGGVLEVWYDPAGQRVQIWSFSAAQGWVQRGANIPVTFATGDRFGARVDANGQVAVYRNSTLLATRDASAWTYAAGTGYVGIWMEGAAATILDDFGGG
jgi:hypothetical protein